MGVFCGLPGVVIYITTSDLIGVFYDIEYRFVPYLTVFWIRADGVFFICRGWCSSRSVHSAAEAGFYPPEGISTHAIIRIPNLPWYSAFRWFFRYQMRWMPSWTYLRPRTLWYDNTVLMHFCMFLYLVVSGWKISVEKIIMCVLWQNIRFKKRMMNLFRRVIICRYCSALCYDELFIVLWGFILVHFC